MHAKIDPKGFRKRIGVLLQGREGVNPFPGAGARRLGEPSTRLEAQGLGGLKLNKFKLNIQSEKVKVKKKHTLRCASFCLIS